jgi:glycosyltransferase involved in cell wall biosynthesis
MTGHPALVWVGRLAAVKDPVTVLRGFALARRTLPGATLTVVHNGGELEGHVRQIIAADAMLAPGVTLLTNVARTTLPALFSGADLFVLGSRHEACGLAVIEALACGAWPVVPAIPAFEAVTARGTAGTLWPAGHDGSLADAIRLAAVSRHPRERIIRFFRNALSWTAVGQRAMNIYRELLAARRFCSSSWSSVP